MESYFTEYGHADLDDWLETHVGLELFKGQKRNTKKLFRPLIDKIQKKKPLVVTIAGTNGKGETCLKLEKTLNHHGIKTLLWTSPHILSVCERFRSSAEQITPQKLKKLIEVIPKEDIQHFSYYEFLFLIFLQWSLEEEFDVLILEVGLGGRLDCVNYLDADLVGLVSISRDHTEILGNTLEKILYEKLAVGRNGKNLYSAMTQRYLIDKASSWCRDRSIEFKQLSINALADFKERNTSLSLSLAKDVLKKQGKEFLGMPRDIEYPSFGRGQMVTSPIGSFILLGSHNTDGLRQMTRWISSYSLKNGESIRIDSALVGFSARGRDELRACIKVILAHNCIWNRLNFISFEHFKAQDQGSVKSIVDQETEGLADKQNLHFYSEFNHFFNEMHCLASTNNEVIDSNNLVTGSYYFLGRFLQALHSYFNGNISLGK